MPIPKDPTDVRNEGYVILGQITAEFGRAETAKALAHMDSSVIGGSKTGSKIRYSAAELWRDAGKEYLAKLRGS